MENFTVPQGELGGDVGWVVAGAFAGGVDVMSSPRERNQESKRQKVREARGVLLSIRHTPGRPLAVVTGC